MSFPSRFLVSVVRVYRMTLSRVLPPSCRFYPTCSQYAITSLERYGAVKGGWLAVKRVSRCHPFNPGGFDPVT